MSDEPAALPVKADRATGDVFADASAPLGTPSWRTVSVVWLGVVYGNIAVMLIAAVALAVALFTPQRPALVDPSVLLVLFTTPAAFLAGLIARDPGQHS
jgi:hypothetical protein